MLRLQQFFPEHMVETKVSSRDDASSLLTHSERYKNLLLQVRNFLHLSFSLFDYNNSNNCSSNLFDVYGKYLLESDMVMDSWIPRESYSNRGLVV